VALTRALRKNARVPTIPEARDWISKARRGNPWRYRTARGELEIAPLVSPLRFDVLLRRSFLDFYGERRELYRRDFEQFARLAREHEYFVWFERVMCTAWQPHVLEDERLLAEAWAKRLHAAAELYDSYESRGFDSRWPITVYEGHTVLPTVTGKRVTRDVYAGDGNHRLALLMAAGQTTLLPSQYRIKRFRRLIPSDTTPRLVGALRVDEERYLAFLRAGYPSMRIERAGAEIHVEGALEAEVRELLRIDTGELERGAD
jgi:hypothetical protein